jgi:hypothetical protein
MFFDPRAPEKLRFGRQQPIYARFSLSRIKPVPLRRLARRASARKRPTTRAGTNGNVVIYFRNFGRTSSPIC